MIEIGALTFASIVSLISRVVGRVFSFLVRR